MGIYDFNILSDNEKYHIVFMEGTFVDVIFITHIKHILYAVDMFFVEVDYCAENNNIIGVRSFIDGALLDRYSNIKNII